MKSNSGTNQKPSVAWRLGVALLVLALVGLSCGPRLKLEFLGQVPEDASHATSEGEQEWRLAESTTWWGRPIDPRKFWQGRVIWNDESAGDAARRHGRKYPPIPVHLTNLIAGFPLESRSFANIKPGLWSGGLNGGSPHPILHYNDAENAYWNWFWRTYPKPPGELDRKQLEVENEILESKNWTMLSRRDVLGAQKGAKDAAIREGYPAEAFTYSALYWTYVAHRHFDHQAEIDAQQPLRELDQSFASDLKLQTNSSEADKIQMANVWKIAYLQRLRKENVDRSYLNAYMQTWNLSWNSVFGPGLSQK